MALTTVDALSTILTTTAGRDKTSRFVQFASKMMKWLLPLVDSDPQKLEILGNLYGNMSMTRKVLRFGREYPSVKSFVDAIPDGGLGGCGVEEFLNVVNKGAFAAYVFADHLMYFAKMGIWKPDAATLKKMDFITEGLWLLETVAAVMLCIVKLQKLEGQKGVLAQKARENLTRALIRNLFDVPVCLHFMKLAPDNIEPGLFGLCGAASSAMSLMDMWPKKAEGHKL